MTRIIALHSFKSGTGRSTLTISLAALLAQSGARVGVIDSDAMSSCIQILVGSDIMKIERILQGMAGPLPIRQVAHNLTSYLGPKPRGQLFVIPKERIFAEPHTTDVDAVYEHFRSAIESLNLGIVLIDTPSGLNSEALLASAISDTLVVVMRLDHQDYQGTSTIVDIAHWLDIPRVVMVVNEMPLSFRPDDVRAKVEQTFDCDVGAVLPHSEEILALGSAGVFSVRYPEHPITQQIQRMAASMLSA